MVNRLLKTSALEELSGQSELLLSTCRLLDSQLCEFFIFLPKSVQELERAEEI